MADEPTFLEVVDEIFLKWTQNKIGDDIFRAEMAKEVEFIIANGKGGR